jgi:predicted small secreted protein
MKYFRILIIYLMLIGCTGIGLMACNTLQGIGQDVEETGQELEEETEEHTD